MWKIYNIFHISLLEYDSPRKGKVDKNITELDINASKNEEDKVKVIYDITVYVN